MVSFVKKSKHLWEICLFVANVHMISLNEVPDMRVYQELREKIITGGF
jgi:hypothetical protein